MTLDRERFWRLRNRVAELKLYERPWSAVGWGALSLLGGAVLLAITWPAAFSGLTARSQSTNMWVEPTLIAACIVLVLVGLLCWIMVLSNRHELERNSRHIVDEMDEIHRRWKDAEDRRRATPPK